MKLGKSQSMAGLLAMALLCHCSSNTASRQGQAADPGGSSPAGDGLPMMGAGTGGSAPGMAGTAGTGEGVTPGGVVNAVDGPMLGAESPLPPAPLAASPGRNINFNVDWKYQQGNLAGADAPAFDDSSWAYVDLPHSTQFVTPETPNAYLGISWYRKHFTVPEAYAGKKVFIEFEAAMQLADVWVNGVYKVQHRGGYTPFSIDITADVSYGGDNVIAVQLDSNANPDWAPGWSGVDFQYHGGLYRNVKLHVTDPLHVTDAVYANQVAGGGVFVTYPSVSAASAAIAIATHVINEGDTARSATLLSEVIDGSGQVVGSASSSSSIDAGADFSFSQQVTLDNPALWHPDTPNLYTLRTTVQDAGAVVDQISTRIGIRSIQWSHDGGLIINGARLRALGSNMHQEVFGLGNAVPDRAIYYDVKRIKEGGMDFIRGAHYPHAPAFYDACDALGIVVLDAQTGWQQYNDTPAFNASTFQELRDMIRRDRNHPSVVAWEASLNESGFTQAWAQTAHEIVHAEYPGDQAYSAQWLFSEADIFMDASQHAVRDSTDPRPIIIVEYGDWDYGGATSTTRQAREAGDNAMLTQANNVQDGTDKNLALSWFSAGSYWDYADYVGFTSYGVTRCGLVDMYRVPKFAYYFMQSQRDPGRFMPGLDSGPMVYIANSWAPTSPTTVRVYSNCEQVALSLNGAPIGTLAAPTATNLLHAPFEFELGTFTPGSLRADCLIGGTVARSVTRQTPGAPAALALRPEASTLSADLSDARLVFVDVLDASGTVVPTDASQVSLSVSGPASIVGPTLITMKGGQLATWVRAGRSPGPVTLTATAPGLASASVELTSEAAPDLPPAPADRIGG